MTSYFVLWVRRLSKFNKIILPSSLECVMQISCILSYYFIIWGFTVRMIVIFKDPSTTVNLFCYIWGAALKQMFYVFTQWLYLLESDVLQKRRLWYGIPRKKLVLLKWVVYIGVQIIFIRNLFLFPRCLDFVPLCISLPLIFHILIIWIDGNYFAEYCYLFSCLHLFIIVLQFSPTSRSTLIYHVIILLFNINMFPRYSLLNFTHSW